MSETDSTDEASEDSEEDNSAAEDLAFDRIERRLEGLGLLVDRERVRGPAERGMLRTLQTRDQPLADREAFGRAHRTLARAIEAVISSNLRPVSVAPRLQPIRHVISPLVHLLVNWILQSQTNSVFEHVRRLYELREANAVWNSADHIELRRARMQMQMICTDLGGSKLGLPLFLVSGAFISGAISVGRAILAPALNSRILTVLVVVLVVFVMGVLATVVLQSASIARRRLRIAFAVPLAELYTSLGSAGQPPKDQCYLIALLGLAFFALAAVAVPSGLYFLLRV